LVIHGIQQNSKAKRYENLALNICDKAKGVGADGILILSQKNNKYCVDIYNADGSWAEKSGNGLRIAAMHLYNEKKLTGKSIDLITGSGVSAVRFFKGNSDKRIISASLGRPEFDTKIIPVNHNQKFFINQTIKCFNRSYIASAVSIGNPHLVLFCDDFEFDWRTIGRELESHKLFPHRINVGFVIIKDINSIEVRDYERGVGPTDSSGTGAAAAVAIAVMRGFINRKVDVYTRAGVLAAEWVDKTDEILIRGPVEYLFSGSYGSD
jgi:diaminopimelate epimerase